MEFKFELEKLESMTINDLIGIREDLQDLISIKNKGKKILIKEIIFLKSSLGIKDEKSCKNCMSEDAYDCRTCTRSDDPGEGKPLQDHWGLDRKY